MIAHCGTANLLAKPFSICFKPQMRQGKVRVTKLHLKSNFMLVSLVMRVQMLKPAIKWVAGGLHTRPSVKKCDCQSSSASLLMKGNKIMKEIIKLRSHMGMGAVERTCCSSRASIALHRSQVG